MDSQKRQPENQRSYSFCVAYTVGDADGEFYAYPTQWGATEHEARRILINNYLRSGRWVARIKLDKCDA